MNSDTHSLPLAWVLGTGPRKATRFGVLNADPVYAEGGRAALARIFWTSSFSCSSDRAPG
jgi:hypothetical protein